MVLGLTALTAALVLVHAGRILNLGFPLMATVVAAVLFIMRPSVYCAYLWWIWLFTPLVRRLVDYQTGYHDVSPVMLTPLLVTSFTLIALLRRPRFLLKRSMLPFFLLLLVYLNALIIGIFSNGPLPAVYEFSNWLLPTAFGAYLLMSPETYAETRAALLFSILFGLLLVSLYGLYQFYNMPPWDAYWLSESHYTAAGNGLAEQTRLFSTLNSPGPFAIILMASLVFTMVASGFLRFLAGGFGFPAFGLTLVRSAWGGWVIAAAFVVWRIGGKARVRILVAAMVFAIIAVPLTTAGPVSDVISKRFSTFSSIQNDPSYQSRQGLYKSQTIAALTQPIGVGFGQFGLASKLSTGAATVVDSGVLLIPFELGWVGGAFFLWAIGALLLRVLNATRGTSDRVAIAGAGVFISMLIQNVFSLQFSGGLGLTLWMGLGLALGAEQVSRSSTQAKAMQNFIAIRRPV